MDRPVSSSFQVTPASSGLGEPMDIGSPSEIISTTSRTSSSHDTCRQASSLEKKSHVKARVNVKLEGIVYAAIFTEYKTESLTERSSSQGLGESKGRTNDPSPELLPTKRTRRSKTSSNSPLRRDHIILSNASDCEAFSSVANRPDHHLRDIRILDIHLDTGKPDDFVDYRLAVALTELHPYSDGINPHNIQILRLVVKGALLVTRYSYHLSSPALFDVVGKRLDKLITGNLTKKEKEQLPYMINSTEKGFSKALLGIRGVGKVLIEGRGHMEASFAATLAQPPGTDVFEVEDQDSPFSTPRMNRTGEIPSIGYGSKANLPYPTTSGTVEYDFSGLFKKDRFLVNEKMELAEHFCGRSASHAKGAAILKPGKDGVAFRHVPQVQVGPVAKNRPRRGVAAEMQEEWQIEGPEEDGRDQDDSLGMEDMMRIKARQSYPEDDGFETMNTSVLPVVLTSSEATVEMGWRV